MECLIRFNFPHSDGWKAVMNTFFLGAAVLLCLDARRSPQHLLEMLGGTLGFLAVPAALSWALMVCLFMPMSYLPRILPHWLSASMVILAAPAAGWGWWRCRVTDRSWFGRSGVQCLRPGHPSHLALYNLADHNCHVPDPDEGWQRLGIGLPP
jgi:hypothetical protein